MTAARQPQDTTTENTTTNVITGKETVDIIPSTIIKQQHSECENGF